jgi:pyruvate,orthophosphate dikinase
MAKKAKKKAARPAAKKSAAKRTSAKSGNSGKFVYLFGKKTDGNGTMKPLLGGKGANLAEMCRIGLPVPPGFTITTEVCTYYYDHKRSYPSPLQGQMKAGVAAIEKQTGKKFGDLKNPLLVSVRSGARDSMPGMMDTILNLGLNDQTVEALAKKTNNPRFAWDCYRRFVQMYGDVVLGVQKRPDEDHEPFETVIETLKHERYHKDFEDTKLTVEDLKELVARFKALVKERAGKNFPASPWDQLMGAISAVFGSWMNDRAIVYRRKYNIPTEWGTAVNVQAMVYGNTGDDSGSGVAFTRNPANGAKEFYGEFLINAQGEDVVAGVRTPEPVAELKKQMPKAYQELERIRQTLERHFKDVPGLRVHDRGRRRLHAADAEREAHGDGGAEVLDGYVQGEVDRLEDGGDAQSRRPARAVARAGVRRHRGRQGRRDCHRTAGRSRRGVGSHLSQR